MKEDISNTELNQEAYNRHYIVTRSDGAITDAWSDGPNPQKATENAICINEHGGYQFRLYPDGEENPPVFGMDGIPLYKWNSSQAVERTAEEIEADRAAIPDAPPSQLEQMRADIDFIAAIQGVKL